MNRVPTGFLLGFPLGVALTIFVVCENIDRRLDACAKFHNVHECELVARPIYRLDPAGDAQ